MEVLATIKDKKDGVLFTTEHTESSGYKRAITLVETHRKQIWNFARQIPGVSYANIEYEPVCRLLLVHDNGSMTVAPLNFMWNHATEKHYIWVDLNNLTLPYTKKYRDKSGATCYEYRGVKPYNMNSYKTWIRPENAYNRLCELRGNKLSKSDLLNDVLEVEHLQYETLVWVLDYKEPVHIVLERCFNIKFSPSEWAFDSFNQLRISQLDAEVTLRNVKFSEFA